MAVVVYFRRVFTKKSAVTHPTIYGRDDNRGGVTVVTCIDIASKVENDTGGLASEDVSHVGGWEAEFVGSARREEGGQWSAVDDDGTAVP